MKRKDMSKARIKYWEDFEVDDFIEVKKGKKKKEKKKKIKK